MIRTNLNIAIVSMAKPKTSSTSSSECFAVNKQRYNENITSMSTQEGVSNSSTPAPILGHTSYKLSTTPITFEDEKTSFMTFDWDEKDQSTVLGSFFWLHWTTQIPGGMLASKYGTKLVFGLCNFLTVAMCFLIPCAAHLGKNYLITWRVIQGTIAGFAWPAMHNLTARWVPPNDRSKFVTAYLGSSIGSALTYPICGFIAQKWGWELVFYACGVAGSVWYVGWQFFVFDSPTQHPRISEEEKDYILESLGKTYTKEKEPVPWKSIMCSGQVWMNILAQLGGIWGFFTLMTYSPSYFKSVHGTSIQTTGFLSGIGHVFRTTWACIFSFAGDYLLKTKKISRTALRKWACAFCNIGQGFFLFALGLAGCNYGWAIIFLNAAVMVNGSVSSGPLACIVDLSPNYAGVILGFVNSIAAIVGFITPIVVGYLTFHNQTVAQWQKVFNIAGLLLVSTGLAFVLFATADLQPWNSPDDAKANKEQGSELISVTSCKKPSDDPSDDNEYKKVPTEAEAN